MNQLKIGARLGLAFGLVLLITALLAVVGISRLNSLKNTSHRMVTIQFTQTSLAQRWEAHIRSNWYCSGVMPLALQASSLKRRNSRNR